MLELYNKPKTEVRQGHKLTGPKEEEQEQEQEEQEGSMNSFSASPDALCIHPL